MPFFAPLGAVAPLAATLAIQIVATAAHLTVPAFAPVAAAEIGIAPTAIGGFTALAYVACMVASVTVPGAPARLGGIRASQVALLLCALGVATTTAATLATMALGAVLLGYGYGMISPASSHVLARRTPATLRSLVFSLKQTGVPIGGFIAGATVPTLVAHVGWRGAALAMAGLVLVTMLAVQPVRPGLDDDRRAGYAFRSGGVMATLRLVAADPALLCLTGASVAFAALEVSVSVFYVTFLTGAIGLDLVHAGLGLSAFHGAGAVSRVFLGAFADRWISPRAMLLAVGLAMATISLAAMTMDRGWSLAAILVLSGFFGAAAICWTGVYLAEVARLAPAGRVGEVTGGCLFFTFLGVVCGPALFGFVATAAGYGAAFALLAVLGLAGGLLAWQARPGGG